MDLKTYSKLAKQLDFRKKPAYLVRHLMVDTAGILLAITLLSLESFAAYAAAQGILAVLFFRGFGLMHDAVHHCVAESSWVNGFAGLWGGILCFMPFHSWKYLHLEHHQWAGNVDEDPSAKLRKDFDPSKVTKYRILTAVWRSWVPLLGLLQEIVFWVYPLQQFKKPNYSFQRKAKIAFSALVPLAFYVGLALAFPSLVNLRNFLPAVFLYLMMVELINFPHHMDVPAYRGRFRLPIMKQYQVSRSSYYPTWFSRHFLLNFNLHTEHHLFPSLPWHQLNKARVLVKAELGSQYNESMGNAWVMKNRKRDLVDLLPVSEVPQISTQEKAVA